MRAVFGVTLKEALRKRTFLVMSIVTLLYLVLWGVALFFFSRELRNNDSGYMSGMVSQLVASMGLNFSQMLVMLLTVMLGAGAILPDIESGQIHSILSRPIRRSSYIGGKFLGLLALACGFAAALYAAVLAMGSLYGLEMIRVLTVGQLLEGLYYYLLAPCAMLCVLFLLSIRLRTIPTGILALFLFVLGNIGGMVEQIGRLAHNADLEHVAVFISLLSPFNTLFNKVSSALLPGGGLTEMISSMTSGGGGGSPSVWMMVWIYAYIVGLFALAAWRFNKKDIV